MLPEPLTYLLCALLIGVGATAVLDIWTVVRQWLGVPFPDYGLLGRWFSHLSHARINDDDVIAATPPVHGELIIGWIVHYAIGVAFAGALLVIWGLDWVRHPTIGPALIVAIVGMAAPLLAMQTGIGLGAPPSGASPPVAARVVQTLISHTIFGLGLYAAGWVVSLGLS